MTSVTCLLVLVTCSCLTQGCSAWPGAPWAGGHNENALHSDCSTFLADASAILSQIDADLRSTYISDVTALYSQSAGDTYPMTADAMLFEAVNQFSSASQSLERIASRTQRWDIETRLQSAINALNGALVKMSGAISESEGAFSAWAETLGNALSARNEALKCFLNDEAEGGTGEGGVGEGEGGVGADEDDTDVEQVTLFISG